MPHKVADTDTQTQRAKVRERQTGAAVIVLQLSITAVNRGEWDGEREGNLLQKLLEMFQITSSL